MTLTKKNNKSLLWSTETHSAAETKTLGKSFGRILKKGDVLLLSANLGSGKTTFVQGLVQAFNIKEAALSPTFTIAQTLEGKVALHHLDFYRLTKEEILSMGIQDYLNGAGLIQKGVVVIEWAEKFKEIWPPDHFHISISIQKKSQARLFTFKTAGDSHQQRFIKWKNKIEK